MKQDNQDKDADGQGDSFLIRADQAAFIINEDGSCEIVLPNRGDGRGLAPSQSLILAIAVRLGDPDWVASMMEAVEDARPRPALH